jgi:hypothetical protein
MGAHALAGMAVTAHTDPPNDRMQDLCLSVIDWVAFSGGTPDGIVAVFVAAHADSLSGVLRSIPALP